MGWRVASNRLEVCPQLVACRLLSCKVRLVVNILKLFPLVSFSFGCKHFAILLWDRRMGDSSFKKWHRPALRVEIRDSRKVGNTKCHFVNCLPPACRLPSGRPPTPGRGGNGHRPSSATPAARGSVPPGGRTGFPVLACTARH